MIARRAFIAKSLRGVLMVAASGSLFDPLESQAQENQHRRWIDAAFDMKKRAESSGDQPYGAVVVLEKRLVGEAPSRVVVKKDWDAHAEREAIRDAQQRLGRDNLAGAILYSTSRPCGRCERVAAEANIARMIHGIDLRDSGKPHR